ncbi:unnamed protein product [Diplocarpon coronariae]
MRADGPETRKKPWIDAMVKDIEDRMKRTRREDSKPEEMKTGLMPEETAVRVEDQHIETETAATEHTTPLVDKALTEKKGTEEDLHGCHLEVEENNSRVIRHKGEVVTALRAHRRHLDADIPPEIVEEIGEGCKEDMMAPMTMIIVTIGLARKRASAEEAKFGALIRADQRMNPLNDINIPFHDQDPGLPVAVRVDSADAVAHRSLQKSGNLGGKVNDG